SGFVVASGGIVATNHHVIENHDGSENAIIVYREGVRKRPFRGDVIWFSEELDLALLQIPGLVAPALPINDSELDKEDRVRAAGFPTTSNAVDQGREASLISTRTGGQVSRYFQADWKNAGRKVKVVQHTAAINRGSSGGPLINQCGEVVGINTFVARSHLERVDGNISVSVKHATFFASHASELASILRVRRIPADIRSGQCGDAILGSSMITAIITAGLTFTLALAAWRFFLPKYAGAARLTRNRIRQGKTGLKRIKTRIDQPAAGWLLHGRLPDSGTEIALTIDESRIQELGKIILGRDPGFCDLVISHATVSSRGHAKFFRKGDGFMISDLHSTNGTYADGVKLGSPGKPDAYPLRDGMHIIIGAVHIEVSRISAKQRNNR
nr:trypsin-like peptidase domain-containing protein [Hyphomicrobiales bacterium]